MALHHPIEAPDWTFVLPTEWKTGEWVIERITPLLEVELPYGDALGMQAMLDDDTNVMALIWPTGQRVVRMGTVTDWKMQEHYDGKLPRAATDKINEVWRLMLKCLLEAREMTEAEIGPPPTRGRR